MTCRPGRCIGFAGSRGSCPHGHDADVYTEERHPKDKDGLPILTMVEVWTLEYAPECCTIGRAGIIQTLPSGPESGVGPCIPGTLLKEYRFSDDDPRPIPVEEAGNEERWMCCVGGCIKRRPCSEHSVKEEELPTKVNGALPHLTCNKCQKTHEGMQQHHQGGVVTSWPCPCGGRFQLNGGGK